MGGRDDKIGAVGLSMVDDRAAGVSCQDGYLHFENLIGGRGLQSGELLVALIDQGLEHLKKGVNGFTPCGSTARLDDIRPNR